MALALLITIGGVILDQGTKALATAFLKGSPARTLVPQILDLTYSENDGMALGTFSGGRWVFIAVTVAVLILIVIALKKKWFEPLYARVGIYLIMSGAIGNLIDRVRVGKVVDMLDLHLGMIHFFVFNIADLLLTIGVIVFFIYLLFGMKDGKKDDHTES